MRKIIVMMSVSLDGYFAGVDGDLSWHHVDEEVHAHFNAELAEMGLFMDGRRTYELMAEFWPTADQDPANAGPVAEFAGIWRDMPKIVFSTTLTSADWNTTVLPTVDPAQIEELKREPGGDIMLGGADLASTFRRLDLIDEYRLYVNPIVLGGGEPMFRASEPGSELRLLQTRAFGNGVVLLRYAAH
jgi:dihydrofolate reductase